MRHQRVAPLTLLFIFFIAGCRGDIELVGYGTHPGIQHGLKVELLSNGPNGALISIQNMSENIISVNQSPLAMVISVKRRKGDELVSVQPCEHIKVHMRTFSQPDDFVIIAPRQTKRFRFLFHTNQTGIVRSTGFIGSRSTISMRLRYDFYHILDHSPKRLRVRHWPISKYRTICTNHYP